MTGSSRSIEAVLVVPALVALATALGWFLRPWVSEPDQVMLLLLVVAVTSLRFGLWASLCASTLAVAAYDVFFIPPYFTLRVADSRHLLTFGMLFGEGILLSVLMARIRRQHDDVVRREARTAALYALSRRLARAEGSMDVAAALAGELSRGVLDPCHVVWGAPGGPVVVPPVETEEIRREVEELARWVNEAGRDLTPAASVAWDAFPVRGGDAGTLVLLRHRSAPDTAHAADLVAEALRQAASTLDRLRWNQQAREAERRADEEAHRTALLSTVSHDLRTPLGVIRGAATALQQPALQGDRVRADLLDLIESESIRMDRLIANLLDMTRLSAGAVALHRQWVPWEELIGTALGRVEDLLTGRSVGVDVASDAPMARVDPLLAEQVLTNLLENAAKYSPRNAPVDLRVEPRGGEVVLEVSDRGAGLPPGAEERVFERFVRGDHPGIRGVGLGLSICRTIVQLHGGRLHAEPRPGGGTTFRVVLPAPLPPDPWVES